MFDEYKRQIQKRTWTSIYGAERRFNAFIWQIERRSLAYIGQNKALMHTKRKFNGEFGQLKAYQR